eukprot:Tbor_TRINITY_DN5793_c0_g3::TRINITY_DN5793_c0_g3_i1::g.20250::m.20250
MRITTNTAPLTRNTIHIDTPTASWTNPITMSLHSSWLFWATSWQAAVIARRAVYMASKSNVTAYSKLLIWYRNGRVTAINTLTTKRRAATVASRATHDVPGPIPCNTA